MDSRNGVTIRCFVRVNPRFPQAALGGKDKALRATAAGAQVSERMNGDRVYMYTHTHTH